MADRHKPRNDYRREIQALPRAQARTRAKEFLISGREMEMPQVKGDDEAYEDRLVILEELGIEENALEHDESTDEVSASSDEAAIKRFFARAFREWAEGNVEGTAQEIFDAVVTLLDSD